MKGVVDASGGDTPFSGSGGTLKVVAVDDPCLRSMLAFALSRLCENVIVTSTGDRVVYGGILDAYMC